MTSPFESLVSPIVVPRDRGQFVVFEGLDGTGTTTQSNLLVKLLREHGVSVRLTSEPSTGLIGSVTRAAIDMRMELDPAALALAFASDRLDHLHNKSNGILASLDAGTWVVCDRYVLSSLAYQAAAPTALSSSPPVFIDTPVRVCAQRIHGRDSRTELFHDIERLRAVLRAYKTVIRSSSSLLGHLITADGTVPEDVVAKQVETGLARWLSHLQRDADAV